MMHVNGVPDLSENRKLSGIITSDDSNNLAIAEQYSVFSTQGIVITII